MKKFAFVFLLLWTLGLQAQPGNNACGSATVLSPNAGCTAGTLDAATAQAGENVSGSCITTNFTQTVWYRFTANATSMYVDVEFSGLVSGALWCPGRFTAVVYGPNPACLPGAGSIVGCETMADGDGLISINLAGLTVGAQYLVQVGYANGAGCNVPNFCIRVGNHEPNYSCSLVSGQACGFATTPTVAQVTSSCPPDSTPELEEGYTDTRCYTFQATNTSVNFNVIINSNCGAGNVSGFSWNLYNAGSCAAPIQSGTLASLTFPGLTVGNNYTFCYTFTVPANCHHSIHYPYFVGAVILDHTLLSFDGNADEPSSNLLYWTAIGEGVSRFFVERSLDGVQFAELAEANPSSGKDIAVKDNSLHNIRPLSDGVQRGSHPLEFVFQDNSLQPYTANYYYRIRIQNENGEVAYSEILQLHRIPAQGFELIGVAPNPSGGLQAVFQSSVSTSGMFQLSDLAGKILVQQPVSLVEGQTIVEIPLTQLPHGAYVSSFRTPSGTSTKKFMY